jgi:uncharacterized lipoprotein YddW (UPF0748 family)
VLRKLILVSVLTLLIAGVGAQSQEPWFRGIWIESWNPGMLSPEQVEEFVATIREANINAIFPEVRKVGDAYYLGGLEPRASNIQGPDDWDPLQHLIDLCHDTSNGQQYIEVHAWLVTFRVWRNSLGDPPPGHLLHEHPEVIMSNAEGAMDGDGSVFADPGHPITEDWTVAVYRDVAARYDIDGIHFDYVRYPEYSGDWGHNPVSLERFRARTGLQGTPEPGNSAWSAWRREQVRAAVRRVYAEVKEVNPDCAVSASTLNWGLEVDPWRWFTNPPRAQAHQDWVSFMSEGILDMNVLMNYSRHQTQRERYPNYTELAVRTRADRWAIIGPGIYLNTIDDSFEQIQMAMDLGADGVNLYDYQGTNNEDAPNEEFFRRLREELWPEAVPVPPRPWIDDPIYGSVIGQVYDDDEWVDGAAVTVDGVETMLTDGTGFFGFFRLMPGEHTVSVTHGVGDPVTVTINVTTGRVARADFMYGD